MAPPTARGNSMWRWLLLLTAFLILVVDSVAVCAAVDTVFSSDKTRLLTITASVLYATFPTEFGFYEGREFHHNIRGYCHRKRSRKNVKDIFLESGPYYVRRAYRMPEKDFWELLALIKPYLQSKKKNPKKKH